MAAERTVNAYALALCAAAEEAMREGLVAAKLVGATATELELLTVTVEGRRWRLRRGAWGPRATASVLAQILDALGVPEADRGRGRDALAAAWKRATATLPAPEARDASEPADDSPTWRLGQPPGGVGLTHPLNRRIS